MELVSLVGHCESGVVKKHGWKRPLGRHRRRWRIILKWIKQTWRVWVDVAQDLNRWQALVNTLMDLRERTVSFSRRTLLHGWRL
jgi:hypothetical protein